MHANKWLFPPELIKPTNPFLEFLSKKFSIFIFIISVVLRLLLHNIVKLEWNFICWKSLFRHSSLQYIFWEQYPHGYKFILGFVKSKVILQLGQDIFDLLYKFKKGITILFLLITSHIIILFLNKSCKLIFDELCSFIYCSLLINSPLIL